MLPEAIYRSAVTLRGEHTMFPQIKQLAALQWEDHAKVDARQKEKLSAVLTYAYTHSTFYREKWKALSGVSAADSEAVLATLPLVSKADLQRSFADFVAHPHVHRVSRKTTGGSTGEPITLLKDRRATAAERAAMWVAYGWHGIQIGDRAARFWGTATNHQRRIKAELSDFVMNRVRFSAFAFSDTDLATYWERCLADRPVYFHGYVSMLAQFARFVRAEGLDGRALRLNAIIATSEVLTEQQRAEIESAFAAPVRGEYGAGEIGSIAFECEAARYHIFTDNVFVEILRPDGSRAATGETGEIVVTDLNNRALPLVRYRIGDNGVLGPPCSCGRSFPVLERIWGRAYDFVEDGEGKRLHGEFFMYFFEDLQKAGVPIRQFQVTQIAPRELRVAVVTDHSFPAIRSKIESRLANLIKGVSVRADRVDVIERAPSGKMQVIKNLVHDAPANA
jgi:phenylacetate-CoA ligase